MLGGLVGAAYRIVNRAMTRDAALVVGITLVVSLVVAAVVAISLR